MFYLMMAASFPETSIGSKYCKYSFEQHFGKILLQKMENTLYLIFLNFYQSYDVTDDDYTFKEFREIYLKN